jgi:hypothetical protein
MIMQGVPYSLVLQYKITQNPGTKHSGVFAFIKEQMEKIDYTKLNNQIVKQAYDSFILTNEKLQELYKGKFERAQAQVEAQKRIPVFRTEA